MCPKRLAAQSGVILTSKLMFFGFLGVENGNFVKNVLRTGFRGISENFEKIDIFIPRNLHVMRPEVTIYGKNRYLDKVNQGYFRQPYRLFVFFSIKKT